ncbi:MAG: CPBP family intramembrane metalloprotease [Bacteroidales bacterium]|nr:CPBP family intramembrane metalloprotease [Bacteroidales bacterium]
MKINWIGGTILLTLFCLISLLCIGTMTTMLGNENEIMLLTVTQIGMWLIPALIFVWLFYDNFYDDLKLKNFGKRKDYMLFFLLYLVAIPFVYLFKEISEFIPFSESWIEYSRNTETKTKELVLRLLSEGKLKNLMAALLVMAVLPAICEEVFFRGVVLNNFIKSNVNIHLSVWISAILFSAVHLEVFGFLSRAILGAVFGYAFVRSKSLWIPIILHFLNNAVLVFGYYWSL